MALVRDSSVFCIPNSTFPKERNIVAGVCIATSIIGFIGASLQLISLWKYRNSRRRTPSPNHRIILYLALSDLFACLGKYLLNMVLVSLATFFIVRTISEKIHGFINIVMNNIRSSWIAILNATYKLLVSSGWDRRDHILYRTNFRIQRQ